MEARESSAWTAGQKGVVGLVAIALVLDGLDAQALGLAVPALIRDWGVTRADLTPIMAASLAAMALGATFGGWVGDRIGRRRALIGSLVLFGLATGVAARTHGLVAFGLLRSAAGLGLGATLPTASALIAEFTPERHRSIGMSIAMLSQPVGSMAAGLLAASLLDSAGWRSLFLIGGGAPLALALFYQWRLRESPGYLAAAEAGAPRASLGALLDRERRHDSLLAWIACFLSLLALYTVLSWGPAMLAAEHFPLSFTGTALASFSVGGIVGSLACGLLMRRLGSHGTQFVIGGVGVAVALVLCVLFGMGLATPGRVGVLMAFVGFSAAGTQTTLYGLGAHLYPTWLRATGMGALLGIGRLGAVASAWAGATSLNLGGAVAFFVLFGVAITSATLICAAIRQPVPPAS